MRMRGWSGLTGYQAIQGLTSMTVKIVFGWSDSDTLEVEGNSLF